MDGAMPKIKQPSTNKASIMTIKELYDYLFKEPKIQYLAQLIASELSNHNLFTLVDFYQHTKNNSRINDALSQYYLELKTIIKQLFTKVDFATLDVLSRTNDAEYSKFEESQFFTHESRIFNAIEQEEKLILYLAIQIVAKYPRQVDDYINVAETHFVPAGIDLRIDDQSGLLRIDKAMDLRKGALILKDKDIMVYPHHFLRNCYRGDFVDILSILRWCHIRGLKVELRLDSFRKTNPKYYREISGKNYWYGRSFNQSLLMDKNKAYLTIHEILDTKRDLQDVSYPLKYTVFHADMMGKNKKRFFISEYVPPASLSNKNKLPGAGDTYMTQKFAHFIFNQSNNHIEHIEGAVRYFNHADYDSIFAGVKHTQNVEKKIGKKIKLFRVSGVLDLAVLQSILYEFFRYNPHISEYFSGVTK